MFLVSSVCRLCITILTESFNALLKLSRELEEEKERDSNSNTTTEVERSTRSHPPPPSRGRSVLLLRSGGCKASVRVDPRLVMAAAARRQRAAAAARSGKRQQGRRSNSWPGSKSGGFSNIWKINISFLKREKVSK